ncbi:MAG: hypothetical protein AB7Y46_15765 [Armatimonadota bacterium]
MRTVARITSALMVAAAAAAPPATADASAPGVLAQARLAEEEPASAPPRVTMPAEPVGPAAAPTGTQAGPADGQEAGPARPEAEGEPPAPEAPPASAEGEELPVPPGAVAPSPEEPPDWRPEPSEQDILINADEVYYQGGATVAEGNVVVRYRDITVTADQAEIDADGVWGQFRGNVVITRRDVKTNAELIRVNFDTETWEVVGGRTVLEPSFFEAGVVEPIYVRARTVSGAEGAEVVDAFDATATSCDLERPHYALHSDHIRLIGEEKVVLESPDLRFFGVTLLRFPWDLVLSQSSRNNRFFPELGQNTVEGYYAKLAYLYLTSSTANSYVRLHLTSKRGAGLGADHYFRTGAHSGEASLFWEPDQGALSGRVRHAWEIADDLRSDLNLSLQDNTGFYGATRSLTGNLAVHYTGARSTTILGLDSSTTDSTFSSSSRFTANLSHRLDLGAGASYDLRTVLRHSQFGAASAAGTLEADFQFQQRRDWFDWALAAEQSWEVEGEQTRNYGLDRLPEIIFNTDSRRLGDWDIFRFAPMRATLKLGHFVQYPDQSEISMAAVETYLGGERTELSDSLTMTATGTFDQAFYDDGSARYRVGSSLDISGEHGGDWFTRLSHRYATVEGFSPLRRDYGGKYNDLSLSVIQQTRDRSYLDLSSGYDFVDDRWQEIRLRGWLTASARDRLDLVAGYSIEDALWRPLNLRWTHATPWDVYLALSSRYDIDGGELTDADLQFDWRLDPRWRLEGVATYSGYRDELDQLNLRLTRDLHCWIATLTYDMSSDELRLNLGIKAFPFEAQDWTIGNRGARLGSYGQYYY